MGYAVRGVVDLVAGWAVDPGGLGYDVYRAVVVAHEDLPIHHGGRAHAVCRARIGHHLGLPDHVARIGVDAPDPSAERSLGAGGVVHAVDPAVAVRYPAAAGGFRVLDPAAGAVVHPQGVVSAHQVHVPPRVVVSYGRGAVMGVRDVHVRPVAVDGGLAPQVIVFPDRRPVHADEGHTPARCGHAAVGETDENALVIAYRDGRHRSRLVAVGIGHGPAPDGLAGAGIHAYEIAGAVALHHDAPAVAFGNAGRVEVEASP